MTTIEVTGLRKRFGRTQALDGMTFTVAPGEVTGFVGPNGAGKSTTMRVILGLDAADAGTALIASASGGRVLLRTTASADAMPALWSAGAEVSSAGLGALAISGMAAERIVALLAAQAIPFSEVSAQQASLEQAYLELTGQAAEFRAAQANTASANTASANTASANTASANTVPANTVPANTVPTNTGAAS
jgi:ATPase subunit of ABC transporter with duplicated ATPase domains